MPGSEADLELLIGAAWAAAETATRFIGGELAIVDKPGGAGPVTAADLAVNAVLEERLRRARPDYGWLSEESPDNTDERLSRRAAFVVDPIDGTRSFIEGADAWAHSMAVVEEGQVTAAVVFLPLKDRMYVARAGGGAMLNGAAIRRSERAALEGASVLAARPALDAQHWRAGGAPGVVRHHRPSLAYRLSLVAEGRFDAMLTLRDSWEWDIAAGALILAEAGAVVTDRAGAPLLFNKTLPQTRGVLAGAPAVHAGLLAGLRQDAEQ
ncbi:MAG: 3'(2'),5'-bisphosphate nucleotidase CysQ [Sediminimonas qiaohouensis]|uniref:3'(2'),5'-bisphosphate nucleotidase CysQ n=1 Tax=Sediminimonas qiaohouensis TaxID=552061 RepID=A0A7C9HA86_9RHOB|nr:3'(2'),5'-bisphosphate nucleotidase CysQ [Sediminimonas qiaohouensis]MTJ04089.1 3'(2'),5'-bisphosphate nucleotidase CysQ [Sediminimonas qiaohouensis]